MASVKQAWIKKYGLDEGTARFNEHKKKYGRTADQLKEQYGEEYVKDLLKRKATHTVQYHIDKHGEIEGRRIWDDIISKKTITQKIRRDTGHVYKNGRTLHEYQLKYGIDKGFVLWEKRNKAQSYRWSLQYYVDKYGEVIGNEEYKKLIIRLVKQSRTKGSVSKSSQLLFWSVYNKLTPSQQSLCKFSELNQEELLYVNESTVKLIKPDFKCGNSIIEFDGTYWHSSSEAKINDKLRDDILTSKGYKILRISESSYRNNKQKAADRCIKFINETA